MNNQIFVILIILSIIPPVFAGDNGRQYITNQDLKKYKKPSDAISSTNTIPINKPAYYNGSFRGSKGEEQKLRRYVIPYKGIARRIIIPVTFNGRVTAPMLLDTGAPGMHISLKLAEKLDISNNDEGKLLVAASGIGGATPAIFTILETIQVGEAEDHFIPTLISPSISPNFEGLIGMDFMGNYSIQIDTKKRVVVFEELPQRSDMPAGHDESWWRTTFYNFKSMKLSWENYREGLANMSSYSDRDRQIKMFVYRQYKEADELYNRLSVYASEHAVPLEWR